MLLDLRFVVGAVVITAVLGMTGLGLFAITRLLHHAKMGPLEASRNAAFTDNSEWNQFYEPGSVRRFVGLARKAEATEAADATPNERAETAASPPAAIALQPAETLASTNGAEATPASVPISTPEEQAVEIAPAFDVAAAPALSTVLDPPREIAAAQASDVPTASVPPADTSPMRRDSRAAETPAAAEPLLPVPEQPAITNEPTTVRKLAGPPDPPRTKASDAPALSAGAESDPPAGGDRIVAAPSTASEPPTPVAKQSPPPAAAPTRSPARTSAVAPAARHAPPVAKRAASEPEAESESERSRAISAPRARAAVSRQRYAAPQPYGAQWNGRQWVNPQPRYAAPPLSAQPPGGPQFGPYFPYGSQPPTARARTQQYRAQQQYGAPAYDPRQFAPPRQSYNNPYGWR